MADDGLMTIGEFSRLVGVTPSALRYYDDCGLLVPAHTSAATGYRFYAMDQRNRASVIRMLRDAGLPLGEVRRILDTPGGDVRQVISEHLVRNADQARKTAAVLQQALQAMLGADERYAQVSVPGPELASGIRQVQHAVDRAHGGTGRAGELSGDGERSEPVGEDLGGVQVEIDADEVRLVATDRHRLALRSLRGQRFEGGAAGVGVAADELLRLVPALLLTDMVVLRVDHSGLTCLIHDQPHVLDGRPDGFPDYRVVLDGIPPAEARLVADRGAALTALVADGPDGAVLLTATGHGLAVIGRPRAGDVRAVIGTWRGPRFQVAFDAAHLEEALTVSVGPDVIIELADGPRPAVVRSADHGAFTTLIMPRAQPGHVPEPARTSRLG